VNGHALSAVDDVRDLDVVALGTSISQQTTYSLANEEDRVRTQEPLALSKVFPRYGEIRPGGCARAQIDLRQPIEAGNVPQRAPVASFSVVVERICSKPCGLTDAFRRCRDDKLMPRGRCPGSGNSGDPSHLGPRRIDELSLLTLVDPHPEVAAVGADAGLFRGLKKTPSGRDCMEIEPCTSCTRLSSNPVSLVLNKPSARRWLSSHSPAIDDAISAFFGSLARSRRRSLVCLRPTPQKRHASRSSYSVPQSSPAESNTLVISRTSRWAASSSWVE
jgi:hypothetical protein